MIQVKEVLKLDSIHLNLFIEFKKINDLTKTVSEKVKQLKLIGERPLTDCINAKNEIFSNITNPHLHIQTRIKYLEYLRDIEDNMKEREFDLFDLELNKNPKTKDILYQCMNDLVWIYGGVVFAKAQARVMAATKEIDEHQKKIEEEEEVIPNEIQQKICWLYAMGVIDNIKDKNKLNTQSNTTIGKILSLGSGIKWDTIKKTIERIEKENLMNKYNSFINAECLRLKIERIK